MLKNYLKITVRNLTKHKAFSLINIFGLAIGMAAFLLLFQYVYFERSYDSFHEHADHIYRVENDRIYAEMRDKSAGCPPAVGPLLKTEYPEVLESARIYNISYWANCTVTNDRSQHQDSSDTSKTNLADNLVTYNEYRVFYAEPSFLKIFSFPMIQGSRESALDEPNTVVISESSARKYFGHEDPMGKILSVANYFGNRPYKITGIFKDIPENSHIKFDFLLSYQTLINIDSQAKYYWGWNAFNTFVLLAPKTDPIALQKKFPQLIEKYDDASADYTRQLILQPLKDIHLHSKLRHEPEVNGDVRTVYFLSIIALFILLIAWVNYINLSTARSTMRSKEVGVRKVLGSQRNQLIKQFIFESMLLNILALVLAVVIVNLSQDYFNRITGQSLTLSLWSPAWLWLGGIILIGAFLSGIYPAFILSSYNPLTILRGKWSRTTRGLNLRKVLVVFQFAMSIILIVAAMTVYRQLDFMRNQKLGMNLEQTLIVKSPLTGRSFRDFSQRFKNEMTNYAAIKGVTISSSVPGKEYSNAASGIRPLNSNPEDGKRCFFITVDYDYFDFYEIEFLAGRKFSREFTTDSIAIILNEEAVKFFGYDSPESAVNEKILLGGLGGQVKETIGVIKNYHHKSLKSSLEPVIFLPLGRGYGNYFSLKMDSQNIAQTISLVNDNWRKVFPGKPFEYFFLDESFNNQYKADQQFGKVFGLFALLAIFVSCLGLFGLISFSAEQRTKEIGVRKVLGASVSGIVGLLTMDFIKLVLLANVFAWPIAYFAMNRWLQNFAYQTNIGLVTMGLAGILALMIALLTVIFQALKAATANPVDAIKYE